MLFTTRWWTTVLPYCLADMDKSALDTTRFPSPIHPKTPSIPRPHPSLPLSLTLQFRVSLLQKAVTQGTPSARRLIEIRARWWRARWPPFAHKGSKLYHDDMEWKICNNEWVAIGASRYMHVPWRRNSAHCTYLTRRFSSMTVRCNSPLRVCKSGDFRQLPANRLHNPRKTV